MTGRECRDVLTPAERAEDPLPLNPNGVKGADITCSNRTGAPVSRGETADYLTARIARDHPQILERMKAGEFRSGCWSGHSCYGFMQLDMCHSVRRTRRHEYDMETYLDERRAVLVR